MAMTWQEVDAYCASKSEPDGFCRVCCSCSGPTFSNLECDYDTPKVGFDHILRGGNYGSCYFEVIDDDRSEEGD